MNQKQWQRKDAVCIYRLQTDSYPTAEDFRRCAYELFKAIEVVPDGKIVLKPNITVPERPESGIVTHPAFIAGIIDYFKDSGLEADRIVIAEKGGGFEESGFTAIAAKREVKIIDLDKDEIVTIPLPQGRIFKEIGVAKSVKDGYLINVPKMKTHNLAITTLAMKNLQGVVTSKQRGFCGVEPWYRGREGELRPSGLTLHEEVFSNKICDLNLALRPNLNVIEGVVGREGTGFHRGTNIPTKFAVAGVDAVTVDAFTSYLMGLKPEEIGYLKIAAERGLGQIDITRMTVYEIREGTLSLCDDVASLVHKPPFKVIRGGH